MSTAETTATAALETSAPFVCECGREFPSAKARGMHLIRSGKTPAHNDAVREARRAAAEAEAAKAPAVEVVAAPVKAKRASKAKAPAAVEVAAPAPEVAAAPEQAPAAVEAVAADPERLAVARETLAVAELATGVRSEPGADVVAEPAAVEVAVTVREVEAVVAACPGIAEALARRDGADAATEQLRAELGAADATAEHLRAELIEVRAEAERERHEADAHVSATIEARAVLGAHNDPARTLAECIAALTASVATVSATASHGDMALRFVEAIAQRDEARRALAGIADAWSAMQANTPAAPRQRPASAPRAVAAPSAPGDTSARPSEAPSAPGIVAAPGKRLQRCVSCGACVNAKRGERCAPCVTANKPVLSAAEWAALTDGARRGTKRTTLDRVAV